MTDTSEKGLRALQAALDERTAERQQYREKLAALLGIDPEKDSVLEEVSKLAVRVRELEAAIQIIFDTAEEHMRNWECENAEHSDWFTIEAECRAVKRELAQEEQRISFAYGNKAIENPRITKEMVREEARKLAQEEPK